MALAKVLPPGLIAPAGEGERAYLRFWESDGAFMSSGVRPDVVGV